MDIFDNFYYHNSHIVKEEYMKNKTWFFVDWTIWLNLSQAKYISI